MLFIRTFLLALAATTTSWGHVIRSTGFTPCSQDPPSAAHKAAMDMLAEEARLNLVTRADPLNATLDLNAYFHVISAGPSEAEGNLSVARLMSQLQVINQDFASTGIKYNLGGITRTVNAAWYNLTKGSDEELEMKYALRQGAYRDVNVYFADLGPDMIGWCSYPVESPSASSIMWDGCVINPTSMPGGIPPFDMGRTLTHELGHWHSLLHTFDGGCTATGDSIDDTPAERVPGKGCPKKNPDTCTGKLFPGVDPIHNFMDFTDDNCMTEFTPGQAARMFQAFKKFRA